MRIKKGRYCYRPFERFNLQKEFDTLDYLYPTTSGKDRYQNKSVKYSLPEVETEHRKPNRSKSG